jgi:hypothetical protein
MKASIWEFEPSGEEPVAGLSLRAREPVFAAMGGRSWERSCPSGWGVPGGLVRPGRCAGCSPVTPGGCGWRRPVGSPSVGCRRAASRRRRGEIYVTQSIRRPGSAGRHGSDRGRHRLAAAVGAAAGGDRGWRPGARSCPAGLRGGRLHGPAGCPVLRGRVADRAGAWRSPDCVSGAALAVLVVWHRRQPRRQAEPGTCRSAGEGSHWAGLPGNRRQRAPRGYSTGPISAPASSA